jgi:hypothetical protein
MAKEPLFTMVAGGALEANTTFNVKCNCGGNAPIKPKSVKGYGFSKKGGATKVVDKLATTCESCKTPITVIVLEGDPGYCLTSKDGIEVLFLPQGSTTPPVSTLSTQEQQEIIAAIKRQVKKGNGKD